MIRRKRSASGLVSGIDEMEHALPDRVDDRIDVVDVGYYQFLIHGDDDVRGGVQNGPQSLFPLAQRFLRLLPAHRLPYLVLQFGELGQRIPAFLKVKIGAGVQSLDDHFFPPPTREQDEGCAVTRGTQRFQELNAIPPGIW